MQVLDRKISPAARPFNNPPLGKTLSARIAREFSTRWEQEWGGKFVLHGRVPGAGAVRLDGNDYLGVTGHPEIVQAQTDALMQDQESAV